MNAKRMAPAALLLALAGTAHAQDLSVNFGATKTRTPDAHTYGWQVSYAHDLEDYLFASFEYQNEGHVPGHHRDGHAVQLWVRTRDFAPGLTFAAGAGPYHYFDTAIAEGEGTFRDAHGWGLLYSVAATWRSRGSPWFYQVRVNRVEAKHNFDTTILMLGAGYRLDQDGSFRSNADADWRNRGHEIVVTGGKTIVNSFESEGSTAKSVEYRHTFTPVLRGSLAWVSEGDARLIRRNGAVAQGWFEPSFYDNRFTLGVGFGGYYAVDRYHADSHKLQGILSTTVSYHLGQRWVSRIEWHRIVSTYDRDSDIILLGLGYRF